MFRAFGVPTGKWILWHRSANKCFREVPTLAVWTTVTITALPSSTLHPPSVMEMTGFAHIINPAVLLILSRCTLHCTHCISRGQQPSIHKRSIEQRDVEPRFRVQSLKVFKTLVLKSVNTTGVQYDKRSKVAANTRFDRKIKIYSCFVGRQANAELEALGFGIVHSSSGFKL